ncbi:zinc finger protein 227-like isoform X2 [Armigeres subalbatus]|uniref:zinc finger protein 227-like isoform X2 n=1 Tax=Armigeres subalbatus TaxID=124917 RepID=UPI002ED47935
MNTTDICRVCMEDDCDTFKSLFNSIPNFSVVPSVIIVECTGISVSKDDGLPEVVCTECLDALQGAYKIREKCRKTDRKLRKILNLANKCQTSSTAVSNTGYKGDCEAVVNQIDVQQEPLPIETIALEIPMLVIKSEVIPVTPESASEKDEASSNLDLNTESITPSDSVNEYKTSIPEPLPKSQNDSNNVELNEILLKQEETQDVPNYETEYLVEDVKVSTDLPENSNIFITPSVVDEQGDVNPDEEPQLTHIDDCEPHEECGSENMEVEALEELEYEEFEAIDEEFETEETLEAPDAAICCGCPMEFSSKTELEEHSKLVHLPERAKHSDTLQAWHMCDVCHKPHSSAKALNYHKRARVSRRMRTCAGCQLVLNSVRRKKYHEQLHRLLPENFTVHCCGCDQVVLFKQLGAHAEQIHHNEALNVLKSPTASKFVCEVCFLDCGFKQRLDNHQAKQEIPEIVLQKPTPLEDDFSAPVVDFDGKQRFVCDICEKNFSTKGNLKAHRSLHITSKKPFKCDLCNKAFSKKCNYKVHMLRIHSTENQFPCPECDKEFKCASNLKTHMRVHTKEKPYLCDFCPKAFGYLSDKRRHEVGHSGNYPFKCDLCGKPYSRKTLLNKHKNNCMIRMSRKSQITGTKDEIMPEVSDLPNESAAARDLEPNGPAHECDLCEDWFSTMEELADHHASVHIQTLDEGSYDAEVEIDIDHVHRQVHQPYHLAARRPNRPAEH